MEEGQQAAQQKWTWCMFFTSTGGRGPEGLQMESYWVRIDLGQQCDPETKGMMAPGVKVDPRGSLQPRDTKEGLGPAGWDQFSDNV